MVRTRASDNFAQQFLIFDELINKQGSADVAQLCQQEGVASVLAPGGFSAAHLCALLNLPHAIPHLASAGAPLSGALTLDCCSPDLSQWLVRAKLDWRCAHLGVGVTPLSLAMLLEHRPVVEALLRAGADASALMREGDVHLHAPYLFPLTRGLSPRSRDELATLACIAASVGEAAPCLELLRAGKQKGLYLSVDQAWSVFMRLMMSPPGEGQGASDYMELVKDLVWRGAPAYERCFGAVMLAAQQGHTAAVKLVLETLCLTVGQISELARSAIQGLQPQVLALILQRGDDIPVDPSSSPFIFYGSSNWCWSCPVLHLLMLLVKDGQCPGAHHNAVFIAEMLAAAGHKPTVYRNAWVPPATARVKEYDPLQMRSAEFDLAGTNRFVWLALHPEEGWSPELHHKYPPAFKAACRAVLLAAARGTKESAGRGQRSPLAVLPQELVLRVLGKAARPISAWVPAS